MSRALKTGLWRLWSDPHWLYALLRIALLSSLAWWVIQWAVDQPQSHATLARDWPRTDFSQALVPVDEFESGGPPKDGIPALDHPRFVSVDGAQQWLPMASPVIVLTSQSKAKAYPIEIMIWHEIVNDEINGLPVVVSFCPLCNAALVFKRELTGRVLDFGTTGWLRMSDLVMYDRQTESWWQQFTGQALAGEFMGAELVEIPARIVSFEDFISMYPQGRVLSRQTGFRRPYGENPYVGYDSMAQSPFLPSQDHRLQPMERVIAVDGGDWQRIYPFSVFRDQPVINDVAQGLNIAVFSRPGTFSALDQEHIADSRRIASAAVYDRRLDSRVLHFDVIGGRIKDRETRSTWNVLGRATAGALKGQQLRPLPGGVHFAFAWLAFRPDTSIYRLQDSSRGANKDP